MLQLLLETKAQHSFSSILQFSDSLQGGDSTALLHVKLKIHFTDTVDFNALLHIQPPNGWRLVGGSRIHLTNKVDSIVRITLLQTRFATSKWSSVKVQLYDSVNKQCLDTFFSIRAPWRADFQLISTDSLIEIADTTRFAAIRIRIINKGSVEGTYQVTIKRNAQVFSTIQLPLVLAGTDTTLYVPLLLPRTFQESQLRLQVYVVDNYAHSRTFPFSVVRRFSELKINASPYSLQNFTLESGLFLLEKKLYHFHEIRTVMQTREGGLHFSFRTRTFGQQLSVERNILTLDYEGKNVKLLVGQLSDNAHFFAYGRGLNFQFNPTSRQAWGGKLILRNDKTIYTNNSLQLFGRHQQRSIWFSHLLAFDLDRVRGTHGYLMYHELSWNQAQRISTKVNISAGIEEFKKINVFHNGDLGLGIGSALFLKLPHWEFGSDLQYCQKSYPGVNKGLRNYQLDARRIFKKFTAGVFYRYNYVSVPVLFDSVYIMDAFKFNMERMGLRYTVASNRSQISISGGAFRQTGLTAGQLSRYLFVDHTINWQFANKVRFQLSSLSGFSSREIAGKVIWFTNSSFDIKWQRAGFKGFFVRQPILRDSTVKTLIRNVETLLFSPYISLKLLKKVPISLRYSISKSVYDKAVLQGIGFSAQFKSNTNNWQIQCSGTVPLTPSLPNQSVLASYPYVSLSIQKSINVPAIFKKKYFTLRVVAFEDQNSSGVYDNGEPLLSGIRFAANNFRFLTDSVGSFAISNAPVGNYEIRAESGFSSKGLTVVSAMTPVQLSTSQLIYIPFRKGHVISGSVKIDLDPFSRKRITPENILVNLTDQLGKKFTTLTDSTGRFFINLPAGKYTVSLNEAAFTGNIRPVVYTFQVDLLQNAFQTVEFELREKRREIRYLNH